MVTLSTEKINNIGKYLSENLHECGIKESEIIVYVDKHDLRKIDEDLYYRLNDNNENKEDNFIPSDNEITILFHNLKFIIKEKSMQS